LFGRNIVQKIFVFEGPGNTFKSTFAEILQNVIGTENCTELRVNQLNERFELYRYFQKNLLIGSDVRDDFLLSEEASFLKKMTGHDLLEAEKKNSNVGFQFRGNFNILITSNSKLLLQLQQDGSAWKRRLVLIPWSPVHREKNIPEFAKKLVAKEGSGILNWVIAGAQKLLTDLDNGKGFLTTPAQAARVIDRIDESDSLSKFLQASVIKSEKGTLRTQELSDAYIVYCYDKGWVAFSDETFARRLPELMASLFGAPRSNNVRGTLEGLPGRGYQRVIWKNGPDGLKLPVPEPTPAPRPPSEPPRSEPVAPEPQPAHGQNFTYVTDLNGLRSAVENLSQPGSIALDVETYDPKPRITKDGKVIPRKDVPLDRFEGKIR